jgi:hypothetical protein
MRNRQLPFPADDLVHMAPSIMAAAKRRQRKLGMLGSWVAFALLAGSCIVALITFRFGNLGIITDFAGIIGAGAAIAAVY